MSYALRDMGKDFYKILGVEKSASQDDVKKAFLKLAHEHHPDKNGGQDEKFKEINEAYQVLGNKELADSLINKGFEQARKFSWDKCARETLELILK